ncbi:G-protein-signaling modulator 2 isoform X1 [Daphnia magna]|uniref:G-protein-signaling modulator 2 isoform X1 n=1 Tax=Daphnia magna TaxID=35525 RepID=UPI0006E7592F|nr:G-protein-signaling modulator 2 isoform X1 [Daphnia magna]CAG4639148.1 EOG090X05CB [Daphnia magna]
MTDMDNSTCLELALEGERLCKGGDCRAGVAFFEAAIQAGTDDLRTLSAIYSQLGNAYFYLGEYTKAMQYHKHDLTLARTMGDRLGEAKASGNLGNTLKVMGRFDEAVLCCKRHLDISRELSDKVGEGRALYNLGNVFHAKGKHLGRLGQQDPGEFPEDVRNCLLTAVNYYEENLELMREITDRAAQGRACGNLGNTHYLLGSFTQAIKYHQERLNIAREFGDKAAERRAHSNLGNAHIFLGEFETAAEHYKKTLLLAQDLGDRAVEAQACYSLGNTYTLLRDYPTAIDYHLRHLRIAEELMDKVGEGRACWSLGNAHAAMGNHEKALHYAQRHLEISREIGDPTGEATAQMNLADLRRTLGVDSDGGCGGMGNSTKGHTSEADDDGLYGADSKARRRLSMERMDLLKLTPDVKLLHSKGRRQLHEMDAVWPRPPTSQPMVRRDMLHQFANGDDAMDEEESFFNLVTQFQSKRMDDQRCSLAIIDNKENQHASTLPSNIHESPSRLKEDLMDLIAGMQSRRMDEQRASLPRLPGLNNANPDILRRLSVEPAGEDAAALPDENFFEMLMRCQGTRLEDQRSALPDTSPRRHRGPTMPDEDFFSLIMRLQSGRLEDQRAEDPSPPLAANGAAATSS